MVVYPTPSRAPDGSLNVQLSPYTTGGQPVTVVSGSLGPGGGPTSSTYYYYLGGF